MFRKIILIFLLLPLKLSAQDITGVWTGTIYNDTTQKYIPYEIAINEEKGKLTGFSHSTFIEEDGEKIIVKSIKIKPKDNKFFIEDDEWVYKNYSEAAPKGVNGKRIHRRNFVARRQRHDLIAVVRKMGDDADHKRPSLALDKGREGRFDVAVTPRFHDNHLSPKRTRRLKYAARFVLELQKLWTARKIGDRRRLGNHLVQQIEPLAGKLGRNKCDARDVAARPVQACGKAVLHRIATGRDDDRNRRGCFRRRNCHAD